MYAARGGTEWHGLLQAICYLMLLDAHWPAKENNPRPEELARWDTGGKKRLRGGKCLAKSSKPAYGIFVTTCRKGSLQPSPSGAADPVNTQPHTLAKKRGGLAVSMLCPPPCWKAGDQSELEEQRSRVLSQASHQIAPDDMCCRVLTGVDLCRHIKE